MSCAWRLPGRPAGGARLRELSLHIQDLIENSVRAGATLVAVSVEEQPELDTLRIAVEDNGPGLGVPPDKATDPFFTTKQGKRTGLGLALFRSQIEQAGGEMLLDRSLLGGTAVRARVSLSHVDRSPLGDLAATLSGWVATNPELELRLHLRAGRHERVLSSREGIENLPQAALGPPSGADRPVCSGPSRPNPLVAARRLYQQIKESLSALEFKE